MIFDEAHNLVSSAVTVFHLNISYIQGVVTSLFSPTGERIALIYMHCREYREYRHYIKMLYSGML